MRNTFGNILTLTTFGESHGPAIGGILDGFPAGVEIDIDNIQREMARRRPGQSAVTSQREETDKVEFLSGIFDGLTTGQPLSFIIHNTDARSADYEPMRDIYRPSHADYTYDLKYGIRDYRGGGRSSARETAVRVAAGAICKQALRKAGVSISAWTRQIGTIEMNDHIDFTAEDIEQSPVRCPDTDASQAMVELIQKMKSRGDTIGGVISCTIKNCPAGIGEPVFSRLESALAAAMLSIPACRGFSYGEGFDNMQLPGSKQNDQFVSHDGQIHTATNHSGGIQGGISNGEDINFKTAFKPVATISREQKTIDRYGRTIRLKAKGRHDPCVLPRAVPIVESMAALVILDYIQLQKAAL